MSGDPFNKFTNTRFKKIQKALSVIFSTWPDSSHSTFGITYIIFYMKNNYYTEKNFIYSISTWGTRVENYTAGKCFVISTQIQTPVELQGLNNLLAHPAYESTFRRIVDRFFQGSWTCKMFETAKSALGLCHHCCHGRSMADVWLASNLPLHPIPLLGMMQGIFMTKSQLSGWALWSSPSVLSVQLASMPGLVWKIFTELFFSMITKHYRATHNLQSRLSCDFN